jgi:hypothetical protein
VSRCPSIWPPFRMGSTSILSVITFGWLSLSWRWQSVLGPWPPWSGSIHQSCWDEHTDILCACTLNHPNWHSHHQSQIHFLLCLFSDSYFHLCYWFEWVIRLSRTQKYILVDEHTQSTLLCKKWYHLHHLLKTSLLPCPLCHQKQSSVVVLCHHIDTNHWLTCHSRQHWSTPWFQ